MVEDREGKETEGADAYILTSGTLLQLYEHYTSELRSDLEFAYKYLNFYVGLNSALLAATIAGLLRQAEGDKKGLLLLFGPLLIIGLTIIGYRTFRVFYRRYIEAWITSVNIEGMLTLSGTVNLERGIQEPRFKSSSGSFIVQFEEATIRKVLKQAEDKSWSTDATVKQVAANGDTLRFAGYTFLLFAIAGSALGVISVTHAFLPAEITGPICAQPRAQSWTVQHHRLPGAAATDPSALEPQRPIHAVELSSRHGRTDR